MSARSSDFRPIAYRHVTDAEWTAMPRAEMTVKQALYEASCGRVLTRDVPDGQRRIFEIKRVVG